MMEKEREKLKTGPWGWIHFLDILECSGPLSLIWTLAQEIITSLLKTIHFVFPIQLMTMRTSRSFTLFGINSYLCSIFPFLLLYNFSSSYFTILDLAPEVETPFLRSPCPKINQIRSYIRCPKRWIHFLGERNNPPPTFHQDAAPALTRSPEAWLGNFIVVLYFINWIFEDTTTNYRVQL